MCHTCRSNKNQQLRRYSLRSGSRDCPLQTATTSECRYRWLRVPATTERPGMVAFSLFARHFAEIGCGASRQPGHSVPPYFGFKKQPSDSAKRLDRNQAVQAKPISGFFGGCSVCRIRLLLPQSALPSSKIPTRRLRSRSRLSIRMALPLPPALTAHEIA